MISCREISFEFLSECSFKSRAMLILLTCFLLMVVIYQFDLKELVTTVNQQREKNRTLQEELTEKKPELSLAIRLQKDDLLTAVEVTDLIKGMSKHAIRSAVEITTCKALAKIEKDFYIECPVRISLSGGQSQIIDFIINVTKKNRLLTIQKLEIEPNKSTLYKQLKMVGILTEHGRHLALVAMPDGIIYQVANNDRLLNHQFRVVQVAHEHLQMVSTVTKLTVKLILLLYQKKGNSSCKIKET